MRDPLPEQIIACRLPVPEDPDIPAWQKEMYIPSDINLGTFVFNISNKDMLIVRATINDNWDHVSVSKASQQMPTWTEMCAIKELFFKPDECVVQYHPPHKDYVNLHPTCLHLWRSQKEAMPQPPKELVL